MVSCHFCFPENITQPIVRLSLCVKHNHAETMHWLWLKKCSPNKLFKNRYSWGIRRENTMGIQHMTHCSSCTFCCFTQQSQLSAYFNWNLDVAIIMMIAFIQRYSPLSSRLTALAYDSTWLTSLCYSAVFNIHRSGVLTALAWLMEFDSTMLTICFVVGADSLRVSVQPRSAITCIICTQVKNPKHSTAVCRNQKNRQGSGRGTQLPIIYLLFYQFFKTVCRKVRRHTYGSTG